MPYRIVTSVAAALFAALSATLVLVPQIVYWLFGLEQNDLGDFLAKRAGVLFFGYAVLCFVARNATSVETKRITSVVVGLSMFAMAALGGYEFALGHAGAGIWLAIAIEVVIAGFFAQFWLKLRRE